MSPHAKQQRTGRSKAASRRTLGRQGGQGPGQGRGANAGEQKPEMAVDDAELVPEESRKSPRQTDKAEGDVEDAASGISQRRRRVVH